MGELGSLDLSWIQGYSGQTLTYIDDGVLGYQCGKHVQFISETGTLPTFFFQGRGVGPFAAHKMLKKFAVAEHCIGPNIFVYNYPSFEQIAVLENGASISFQKLEFSYSNYMLSLSGLPDFTLIIWDYEKQQSLASLAMTHDPCNSVAFNPLNREQVCVSTSKSLTVVCVEHNYGSTILQPHHVRLPSEEPEPEPVAEAEKEQTQRGNIVVKGTSGSITRFKVTASIPAIAGLTQDQSEQINLLEDSQPHISPLGLTWTPQGDIIVSGSKGHLIRVHGDSFRPEIVYYPKASAGPTDLLSQDWKPGRKFVGRLECLILHQLGLFAVSEESEVILFDVMKAEAEVIRVYNLHCPITSLTFSYDYCKIAIGSSRGAILVAAVDDLTDRQQLADIYFGQFVSIGILASTTESICVTARSNGMVQVWAMADGMLLSSVYINEQVRCMACSPLVSIVAVGTVNGYVYFIDSTYTDCLRIVHRVFLYTGPCKNLVFDEDGLFLFTSGSDGNVFVMHGRPSNQFNPIGYIDVHGQVLKIATVTANSKVKVAVAFCYVEKKSYSTDVVFFEITDALMKALSNSYKNSKREFMDTAINRTTVNFPIFFHDLALGHCNQLFVVASQDGSICTLDLPQGGQPEVIAKVEGNQLLHGQIMLSPDLRWLASYGRDGRLVIHSVNNMEQTVQRQLCDYHGRGILQTVFSMRCDQVLSIGHGGLLCCCEWKRPLSEALGDFRSLYDRRAKHLEEIRGNEQSVLSQMKAWVPPPPAKPEKHRPIQKLKEESMDKGEVYESPPPSPIYNATWLQEREHEVFLEERKEYITIKRHMREALTLIRRQLQDMMNINDQLPDLQKLEKSEYQLDLDEQVRQQHEEEMQLEEVRQDILCKDQVKTRLTELIKRECWDNMFVKGRAIKAFNSDLLVFNFPMVARSKPKQDKLAIIMSQRRVELMERAIRNKEDEKVTSSSDVDITSGTHFPEDPQSSSMNGSMLIACGVVSNMPYSQFELQLRHQKIKQIALIEDCIFEIRSTFNKEFDALYTRKEADILNIRERNKRVALILKSLERSDPLVEPTLTLEEKPEQLFVVHDHEVKVEKVLSETERKRLEEQEILEKARLLKDTKESDRARALDVMMGGVLEISREELLKQDIPVPSFMEYKEKDEWNEDEQRIYSEYKAKVKELNKERETFRKQLETELHRLQNGIENSMKAFDEMLQNMNTRRMLIEMTIGQEEMKIIRLRMSLLREEELLTWIKQIKAKLANLLERKDVTSETVKEFEQLVDSVRGDYEIMLAEDRIMEKGFKRDFQDIPPVVVDMLYRHFKKRPKLVRTKVQTEGRSPNPFAENMPKQTCDDQQGALAAALDEMDRHMPENYKPEWWQRMCEYRRNKIDSENKIKQKVSLMAELQACLQKRRAEDEALKKLIDVTSEELTKVRESYSWFTYDVELQLLLTQDQVEVDPVAFVRSYEDCLMVDRSTIVQLNNAIKKLGEEKISLMEHSKEHGKGIIRLEWEHKKLHMQLEDVVQKQRQIQRMKVTREVQAFLKEKDYNAKKARDMAHMEQTIALQQEFHEKAMKKKQDKMKKIQQVLDDRAREHAQKSLALEEFNIITSEHQHIEDVYRRTSTAEIAAQQRLRHVYLRKQLIELAQQQAQHITALQAEQLRLRLRSFPSFQNYQY